MNYYNNNSYYYYYYYYCYLVAEFLSECLEFVPERMDQGLALSL